MNIQTEVKQYEKLIWKIINSEISRAGMPKDLDEDIWQEVMIELQKKLPSYDPEKSKLSTLIGTVTTNVFNRYRHKYFDFVATGKNFEFLKSVTHKDDLEEIRKIVQSITRDERIQTIVMSHMEGYSFTEIAKQLGVSVATISREMSRFKDLYTIQRHK